MSCFRAIQGRGAGGLRLRMYSTQYRFGTESGTAPLRESSIAPGVTEYERVDVEYDLEAKSATSAGLQKIQGHPPKAQEV